MSEADSLPAETDDLTKMLSDLDIDHRLASAAQKGDTIKVRELLASGAQVTTDEVKHCFPHQSLDPIQPAEGTISLLCSYCHDGQHYIVI